MLHDLYHEWRKYRALLIGVIGALLVFLALMYLAPVVSIHSAVTEQDRVPHRQIIHPIFAVNYGLSALSVIGPFITALIGARALGSEYQWRTLRTQLVQAPRRRLLVIKLGFIGLAALSMMVVMAGGALVGAVSATAYVGMSFPAGYNLSPHDVLARMPLQIAVTWLGLTLWGWIALLGSMLLRSTLAGFLIAMALPYAEMMLRVVVSPSIAFFLPAANQIATLQIFTYIPDAGLAHPSETMASLPFPQAFGVTVFYSIVIMATCVQIFQRQEM